jgi:holo-[acyl-carrier protein] synthase
MKLVTGVDLIEVRRIEQAVSRHGRRFLERVFTEREMEETGCRVGSLAARFAAKEAVSKALGTGIGRVSWREIEILRGPERQPVLHLHGEAARLAEALRLEDWAISLSHTREHALAQVVAVCQKGLPAGRDT